MGGRVSVVVFYGGCGCGVEGAEPVIGCSGSGKSGWWDMKEE